MQKKHVIKDASQLRALRTPVRWQVLRGCQRVGPCSVAELAAELERSPHSLYYHVDALLDAGLLIPAGTRRGRGRPESLVRAVAQLVQLDIRVRDPDFLKAIGETYQAALAESDRHLERGLRAEADESGERTNTALLQLPLRLSASDLETVRARLLEIVEMARQLDDPRAENDVLLTAVLSNVPKAGRG